MFKFNRSSGIHIPRECEVYPWYQKIIKHLTRRSKQYQTSDFVTNIFCFETEKDLIIPRFFPLDKYVGLYDLQDLSHVGKNIDIQANIIPRNKLQENAIKYVSTTDRGIIQLEPGSGKTVIMIAMIAKRRKKTLILVHRDSLVEQWKDRILHFTNMNSDEIVRITSKDFETRLTKSIGIITNQTFISLLKTKRNEFLSALNKANIGVFIADEVHTSIGAPVFAQCSIHVPARCVYGLSATPYRWDGNEDVIKYHLGDIYQDIDYTVMTPKVLMINIDLDIVRSRRKYLYWAGEFQRSRYLNMLVKSARLDETMEFVFQKLKETDRNSIIVCERLKLIDKLYQASDESSKSKFTAGGSNELLKSKIVFATPGKIRDGIDVPEKDTLIMTSPISNIKQMVGRICRVIPNKKQPLVVDIVDIGCNEIERTKHNRLKYYQQLNCQIQEIIP